MIGDLRSSRNRATLKIRRKSRRSTPRSFLPNLSRNGVSASVGRRTKSEQMTAMPKKSGCETIFNPLRSDARDVKIESALTTIQADKKFRNVPLFNLPKNYVACPITPAALRVVRQSRLEPAIHAELRLLNPCGYARLGRSSAWIRGSSPRMTSG
jgi:hypothetical protein